MEKFRLQLRFINRDTHSTFSSCFVVKRKNKNVVKRSLAFDNCSVIQIVVLVVEEECSYSTK